MCGILGSTTTQSNTERLKKATDTLLHRGPDYQGVYQDADIYISHLLLAIRGSTEESKQPVFHAGNPWVLVFNGQLYNTKQICNTLNVSNSGVDTTLLYKLIEKFGWDFIDHIQGMFAIALYNSHEKIIRLYRDQSGQKGLYYRQNESGFHFASEIKGVLSLPNAQRSIDVYSLELAQRIGYIPGNRTLVKDLFKVMPSEIVAYDLNRKALSQKLFNTSDQNYYAGLTPHQVLHTVVEEHLQSKRDLSINLSGGLDSSLIFHEAVQSGRNVTAFSTLFDVDEEVYNRDAVLAKRLAQEYGQEFTEILITKESYLDNFIDSYKTIEEPNFNISVPIYYQTAKREGVNGKGLRVVLSGDGGDELFGGYPHYAEMARLQKLRAHYTLLGLNLYKWYRNKKFINYGESAEAFYALRGFTKSWTDEDPNHRNVLSYLHSITDEVTAQNAHKQDGVYRLMLLDRYVWLASENFIRSDKLYMSQSMEMRCPLAYQPLRTYMDMHIPSSEYTSRQSNKLFLRNLYADKLPTYITKRMDKTGWRAPVEIWYDKTYKTLFLDIITSVEKRNADINWNAIKKKIESSDTWPGKTAHLYLSIALTILSLDLHD